MTKFCKKTREVLRTRRMQFAQRCWNFSPEVWKIIAQSPKTILENSRKIIFLKVLLWTSKLVLTTCLKNVNECSKKCSHSPERTKSFLTNFFLMDMFILAWRIQFGPPSLEGYTEKTKKMFPGRPKKIRESKNSFKTILPIAHLETKEQIWYEGCKISAANQTFPCPKSKIASQSPLNVFVEVILWTREVHFWQFYWKNSTKLEKSLLNFHSKLKKSFSKK